MSTHMLTCEIGILCQYVLLEYTDFYVNVKDRRTVALSDRKSPASFLLTKDSPPTDT